MVPSRPSRPATRVALFAALMGTCLFGCALLGQSVEGITWVAVTGPADAEAPEELVLEIGDRAWDGYGGVVSVDSGTALPVRLVGRVGCRTYASFQAAPRSSWVIRFANDGTVSVEDWTGRPMDAGPALSERPPSNCPSS